MLISIIAGALLSYHLIDVYGLPWRIKRIMKYSPDKRIKPFDCRYCLGGWLALAFYFLPDVHGQVITVLLSGAYLSKLIK